MDSMDSYHIYDYAYCSGFETKPRSIEEEQAQTEREKHQDRRVSEAVAVPVYVGIDYDRDAIIRTAVAL